MPKLNAATRLSSAMAEDDFKAHAKTANEYLTDAVRVVDTMVSRSSGELKVKAQKLEKLIDEARHYAFSLR